MTNLILTTINIFICIITLAISVAHSLFILYSHRNMYSPTEVNDVDEYEDNDGVDDELKQKLNSFYSRLDEIKIDDNISAIPPDFDLTTGTEIIAPSVENEIERKMGFE